MTIMNNPTIINVSETISGEYGSKAKFLEEMAKLFDDLADGKNNGNNYVVTVNLANRNNVNCGGGFGM